MRSLDVCSTKEVIPEEVKKYKIEISAKYWYPGLRRTGWDLDSCQFWNEFFREMSTAKLGFRIYVKMSSRVASTKLISLERIYHRPPRIHQKARSMGL